jgi:hypothetical protein
MDAKEAISGGEVVVHGTQQKMGVESPYKSTLVVALRWATFLPAAAVGGVLAHAVFVVSIAIVGARSIPFFDDLVANGLAGFAFVFVGALVAPAARRVVSLVLVILFSALVGFTSVGSLALGDKLGTAELVASLVGAGVGFLFGHAADESE